jgi:SAM-dependent methyltransferase
LSPHPVTIAKKIIPRPLLKRCLGLWNLYVVFRSAGARRAFENCEESGRWLEWEDLENIYKQYPSHEKYSFDPDVLEKRGRERAGEIVAFLPRRSDGLKSLELGALDAMTSYYLAQKGISATAIDITDSQFTDRVRDAGVSLHGMDAGALEFDDGSFDLVFSYNSFEHFSDPAKVLMEAIRVLKPGGYLYVYFGPLYPSPFGLHGYESIPVPYIQFLFQRETIEKFCADNNLGTIEVDTLNMWPAIGFRELFGTCESRLRKIRYVERYECTGSELIVKYPECFRGKVSEFDGLIIAAIEGLWQKR